jgi:hypothetical protein
VEDDIPAAIGSGTVEPEGDLPQLD